MLNVFQNILKKLLFLNQFKIFKGNMKQIKTARVPALCKFGIKRNPLIQALPEYLFKMLYTHHLQYILSEESNDVG